MAEVRDDEGRVDLYRKLLNDPATRTATAKLSYKQWESKLLNDDNVLQKVGEYATKKNWALDADDFLYKYAPEKAAPPTPKPQAAPKQEFMEVPALEEQEAYVPEPQPLVGSPEYNKQLQKQYGGMAPTLGATFGGVPAAFETKEQKKQEQLSPAFKAQQLAFEDVPIAEEQRRAQKQFAKATKQQQQAALRGGTGFELQQEKRKKERGYGEWGADVVGSWAESGKRIAKNILSTVGYFAQTQAATDPMANLPYEKRQEMMQQAGQTMYDNATAAQNSFQDEISKRNIQTSVLQAINKGEYSRLPESVLYTVGDAAMQIIPSILTMGGSTYMQTLPQVYKDGVDAIAKEKGISPEQVVASGDDAFVVSQINAGLQSALEYMGAGFISKSIASRGAYKAMRDYLLKQGVNRNLARGASLLGVGTGEALTEYGQEGVGQIGKTAAKSPTVKAFFDKLPNELFTPEAKNQRAEAFVGGLVGGLGLAGGGQVVQSAMDRTLFEAPKIGKATQRPDMDVVQTDNKIQERNKIAQAMEEAVKANPEAEGQIRQQYQKRINEAAPTDEEVLSAYDGLAVLPETEEKNTIRENLEAYMAEKGIQPEPTGMEAGLGEGLRVTSPVIQTVNADFPPPQPPTSEEEVAIEEAPTEEELSLEDQLMGLVPQEETAPAPAEETAQGQALTKEQSRVKDIINDIYFNVPGGRNGSILDEGFGNAPEALERANRIGGNQYSAHGMGKTSVGSAFTDLYNLLTKGIDPSRGAGRLYTAPLSGGEKGAGAGVGTGSGNAYMDGPFTLVANKGVGAITDVSQIGGIIVNDGIVQARPEILDALRAAFPNIVFESTSNTDKLVEQLNQKAEQQVSTEEEIAEEPTPLKDGDFVIVNGEKGVVTISPGGQISVETDTKIYDLDERGLAGIGGKLVTPKEQTQTEYEVEVIDDDNAVVNGEPYKIIRDEKGNTIALQGETRTIRTEPVMVDVDIKRNKAQVTETLQEQAEEVESLSPDMTLDKQKFVDDIIGQNMTEGVDRILSEGVTEKTAEKDLLQFKLFVEATIADLRARQKGNPYADAMIEQLQEALNTVYYEYYSQGRKAETRAAKTQKKTDRGTKGKERVSPKPAEGKQPAAPVKPTPAAPKKEAAPKPEPKKEAPKPEPKKETPKEEKPVSGTPQEGDKVEIAPQREGGSPRNMVFKDGEWKQNVGGDIVKVGPAVQQQAQEAFGGKAEVKPAETKEEKVTTPEFTSSQSSEAATAFDKAKTSKGFDKKYGKGAYKALSDITKNFDAIMDKVSDKIKQDCL
jgi:hypothetical protein